MKSCPNGRMEEGRRCSHSASEKHKGRSTKTARTTNRRAGGIEINRPEAALKDAIKDADLEIARVVLGARTPRMALLVRDRS